MPRYGVSDEVTIEIPRDPQRVLFLAFENGRHALSSLSLGDNHGRVLSHVLITFTASGADVEAVSGVVEFEEVMTLTNTDGAEQGTRTVELHYRWKDYSGASEDMAVTAMFGTSAILVTTLVVAIILRGSDDDLMLMPSDDEPDEDAAEDASSAPAVKRRMAAAVKEKGRLAD